MMSSHPLEGFHLDIFAQQPRINTIYTQLLFCFAHGTSNGSTVSTALRLLTDGLRQLNESFPWTAGLVVEHGKSFQILSWKNTNLIINDLRSEAGFPTRAELASKDYPYRWLDEKVVSARNTIANIEELKTGLPVLAMQANVLHGGLMVSFDCQHGAMDMAGQAQLIRLLAKACRSQPFTSEELSIGNIDREATCSAWICARDRKGTRSPASETEESPQRSMEDFSAEHGRDQQTGDHKTQPMSSPSMSLCWTYFRFNSESLTKLKHTASREIAHDSFVSTDDVLSAFVWQAICRVRGERLNMGENSLSTLSRNVDARPFMSLPSTYPGLLVISTSLTMSLLDIEQSSIASISSDLRAALSPAKIRSQIQTQMASIREGEKGRTTAANRTNPALDVRLSSWAKEDCYGIDFGLGLGIAEAVRTPRFENGAREGLVYFLPKELGGSIVVGVCLRTIDMQALKQDAEMAAWSQCIE